MKIKTIKNKNIKFYSYQCRVCGSTIDAYEYERNDGRCWRCAGNYDPY